MTDPNEHGNDQGNTTAQTERMAEVRTKMRGGVVERPRIHDAQVRKAMKNVHTT